MLPHRRKAGSKMHSSMTMDSPDPDNYSYEQRLRSQYFIREQLESYESRVREGKRGDVGSDEEEQAINPAEAEELKKLRPFIHDEIEKAFKARD